MESKVKKTAIASVLLAIIAAVAFMLVPQKINAAADAVANEAPTIEIYQGAQNRYYYCGDLSEGTLYHMLYSTHYTLWQGNEEFCRVYAGNAVQTASENSDSIRATVISKDGKISLRGSIDIFNDTAGDGCRVGIAMARGGDLNETEWIVPVQSLVKESESSADDGETTDGDDPSEPVAPDNPSEPTEPTEPVVPDEPQEPVAAEKITLGAECESIDVAVGDVVMYVAEAMADSCGAVFGIDIVYDEISGSGVPVNNLDVSSIPVGDNLNYDSAGNVMRDPNNIFLTAMATDNRPEDNLQYVYQPVGLQQVNVMDFAGWNAAGYWYTMPNASNSVGAVWQNKFYTNPNGGYGYSGLCYTAPTDGLLSVSGATGRSETVEAGDDASSIGSDAEFARWSLIRIEGDKFTRICGDGIETGKMKSIEDVAGTQNITLKAGEKVFLRYECSAPWKVSCITAAFRFVAPPSDVFEGWLVSGDVTEEQYAESTSLTQGENGWYSAYGDEKGKYYLLENKDGKYYGKDVYTEVWAFGGNVTVSASSAVMKVYKAVGGGSATVIGNVTIEEFAPADTEIMLYKRTYNGEGWDEAQLLSSERMHNKKMFSEFKRTENLSNGDLLMVVLRYRGAVTEAVTVNATLNVYVDFDVTEEGTEVQGIGEVQNLLITDWYPSYQGEKGWFCAYGDKDNYALMDYGFGNDNYAHWVGPEWNSAIDDTKQMPSAYSGTLRIYVCDRAGEFVIEGMASLLKTDGLHGVSAAVYHNGETVWLHDYEAGESDPVEINLSFGVQKGDNIMLWCANKEGNVVAYGTEFFFNVAYALRSDSDDVAAEDELISFITPASSYAEYLGIAGREQSPAEVNKGSGKKKKCGSSVSASLTSAGIILLVIAATVIARRKPSHE